MERLTKWNEQIEQAELLSWDEEEWKDFMGSLDVPIATELSIAINKLAEYEDLEEHGLLIRLPCKFGTPVYDIKWWDDKQEKVKIDGKYYYRTVRKHKVSNSKFGLFDIDDFGKTVFLTKEAAEAALKEMEK